MSASVAAEGSTAEPASFHRIHTMPSVHPFSFNVHRAVRLAQRYRHFGAARTLLVQLHAYEQAIALADTFEEGVQVVTEVCSAMGRLIAVSYTHLTLPTKA